MPTKTLILYFYKLDSITKSKNNSKPYEIYIKYFENLETALQKFNEQYKLGVTKLYNEFAQEIPLTYNVQKTGLNLYYQDHT